MENNKINPSKPGDSQLKTDTTDSQTETERKSIVKQRTITSKSKYQRSEQGTKISEKSPKMIINSKDKQFVVKPMNEGQIKFKRKRAEDLTNSSESKCKIAKIVPSKHIENPKNRKVTQETGDERKDVCVGGQEMKGRHH